MPSFELITEEFGRAVAAILPEPLTMHQFYTVNGLLPESVVNQPELARRWEVHAVLSTRDWARAQLRRTPMLRPKGLKLAFL